MQKTFVNGKKIRDSILDDLVEKFSLYIAKTRKKPILAVFIVGENKVINQFVSLKRKMAEKLGILFQEVRLPKETATDFLIEKIKEVSLRSDGLIVQLPLPEHVNEKKVLNSIPTEIDVDLLNQKSIEFFEQEKGDFSILPPVAGAVYEILKREKYNPIGKNNILVGFGKLVGQPVGALLHKMGAEYKVIKRNKKNKDILYEKADLIISGAGDPGIIISDMISDGVFLIDAGTSSANSKIVGDIDLRCLDKASVFSKTPGGVGPIAVAMIFKNLFALLRERSNLAKK